MLPGLIKAGRAVFTDSSVGGGVGGYFDRTHKIREVEPLQVVLKPSLV